MLINTELLLLKIRYKRVGTILKKLFLEILSEN